MYSGESYSLFGMAARDDGGSRDGIWRSDKREGVHIFCVKPSSCPPQ